VRGQSQYCRVSTHLESLQYVLENAKINLICVLITLSYFTDISIYSSIYKYIFSKYFFFHYRPFFPSCVNQDFYWKTRKVATVIKESVFKEEKGSAYA